MHFTFVAVALSFLAAVSAASLDRSYLPPQIVQRQLLARFHLPFALVPPASTYRQTLAENTYFSQPQVVRLPNVYRPNNHYNPSRAYLPPQDFRYVPDF